jgi:putrescine transport system ATP-binding protein
VKPRGPVAIGPAAVKYQLIIGPALVIKGQRPSGRGITANMRRGFAPWSDPDARPLVRFEAVTKRFGGSTAVDALTLDVYPGEFFALLGPSGCGKTTLLRMLAGFEMPDAGRIRLGGDDIAGVPPYRRPVNMMFQSYALFPHLTVAGNIAFGLKQDRLPRAAIEARVAEMLALVRLDGFAAKIGRASCRERVLDHV